MRPRLLMIGGGHSHLVALRYFSTRAFTADITLISRDTHSIYSGMLPGAIAGHYTLDDTLIHLPSLCRRVGVNWHRASVTAIDPDHHTVRCDDQQQFDYDVVSIDTGTDAHWPGLDQPSSLVAVKPVATLFQRWRQLHDRVLQRLQSDPTTPLRIATVGAGAAGIEVTLAMYRGLQQVCGAEFRRIHWLLFSATPTCMSTHNRWVQARVQRELRARGFELFSDQVIEEILPTASGLVVTGASGQRWPVDEVLLAIPAGGQSWLADSALATSGDGFVRVNRQLQSVSHASVFAAGDIAHFEPQPLPKSGVYAVRQGGILAHNLLRQLQQQSLQPFKPQPHALSLVSLGDQRALASRGALAAWGAWVWHWKDRIDRRFVAQFKDPHW